MKNVYFNQLINEDNMNSMNSMDYLVNNLTSTLDKISALRDKKLTASTSLPSTATVYKSFKQDELKLYYHNIEKKLSILPIFLMIAGTLGNLIALYVLTRKKLRHQSTMLYFASLTIMDTLSLYQWNFNFFYKYQLNSVYQNLEDQSLFLCRYISFMAYFSMQTSAWILTIISIDRYLIITNYYWKQKFSRNIKFSIIIIVTVILIIALINFPTVFLNGKVNNYINIKSFSNSTPALNSKKTANVLLSRDITIRKKVECYTSDYIIFWQKFSLLLECLFPLILMIVFNLLLINRTYKSSINLQKKSKEAAPLPKVSSIPSNQSPANSTNLKTSTSCYDLAYLDQSSSAKVENSNTATFNRPKSKLNCLSSFRIPCLTKKNDLKNSPNPNPSVKHKKKSALASSKRKKRLDSYIEEETTINDYSTTVNNKINELSSAANSAHDCNESLANLEFLKYSYSVNKFSLLYKEPTSSSFAVATTSFNQLNNSLSNTLNETEAKYSSGETNRQNRHATRHATTRSSDRKINSLRNRRIVLMLSLLTLSFTLSTLPSSVFYTFLRPIINDKPYKRLLTMSFNLLRHLSHAFNFIIYFTSSSVIKQQLKETIRDFKKKKVSVSCCLKFSKYWCCCFLCFIPIGLKHLTNRFQASSSTQNKRRKKTQSEPQLEASFVNNQDFASQNKINGVYLDESYIFNQKSMRRNSLISVHSNLFGNINHNNNASKAEDQVKAELIPNNSISCVNAGENSKEAALGDLNNLDNSSKLKVNSFRKKKFFL